MTDLESMPTRELCEKLAISIRRLRREKLNGSADLVEEAARRLSRYAPVRIDPEDESTWPTKEDADAFGYIQVWEDSRWWLCYWDAFDTSRHAHYRRIDNEPPE